LSATWRGQGREKIGKWRKPLRGLSKRGRLQRVYKHRGGGLEYLQKEMLRSGSRTFDPTSVTPPGSNIAQRLCARLRKHKENQRGSANLKNSGIKTSAGRSEPRIGNFHGMDGENDAVWGNRIGLEKKMARKSIETFEGDCG